MLQLLSLFGAGVAAGAMNALAGGGTFAAFPALLGAGLPPTVANATSNVALLPGAAASTWSLRRALVPFGPLPLRTMAVVTLLGGAAGALLLRLTSESAFRALVPWLLAFACVLLTFGKSIRAQLSASGVTLGARGAVALQFVLGIYGGYFGGAVGLLMMATWALVSDLSHQALAPARTFMLACANAAACLLFAVFALVDWWAAAPVAAGGVLGGLLGARLGARLPEPWVRVTTLVATYAITLAFFLRR